MLVSDDDDDDLMMIMIPLVFVIGGQFNLRHQMARFDGFCERFYV